MSKELILKELQKRNIDTDLLEEIEKREISPTSTITKTTPKVLNQQESAFPEIQDYGEIAPSNERSKAVEDYLTSPAFGRLVLEVGGAVTGSILAPQFTLPRYIGKAAAFIKPSLEKAFTTMAGAGFGEATGAGVSQTFDPTFDSKDDFEKIAKDISKDLLRAYATGATAEGAGILINKGVAKVIGKNKKLIDGAEEAIETIENQKKKIFAAGGNEKIYNKKIQDAAATGQITPGLLQEGQLIDLLENVSELSLIGSGSIRTAREGAETIASSGVDDFVKNFKVSTDNNELGVLFQKVLTDDLNAFRAASKTKYGAVDKALSRTTNAQAVNILDLKKFADKELDKIGLKTENEDIIRFLNDIKKNPNNLTFKAANEIRSDLLEISREFTGKGLGKKKQRLSNELAKKITTAMDEAPLPNETIKLYKDANKFYREGAEIFNNKLFTKIIENDPELVYKSIVAAGDRPTLVKKTFGIIDSRIKDRITKNKLKNSIRGQFLEDAISKSQKSIGQYGLELDASKLNNFIAKNKMTTDAMFTKPQLNELQRMVNALAFTQGRLKKRGGLPGAIFIQMKQSGAVMTLAGAGTGAAVGGLPVAASIILAPEILAKAFTSPKIVKLLTTGFKYDQSQSAAGRTFRQIIGQMSKENLISEDERDQLYEDIKQGGYK